jgi:hypothetical protein
MTRVAHNKGKPSSMQARIKLSISRGGKPFVSLLDGVIQERFHTLKQAGDFYKVSKNRVLEVLTGERKSTRGVTFKYE